MKIVQKIFGFLPHLSIIFSLCFIAFTVLDWYNPMMNFTTNATSVKLLLLFCIITIISSIYQLLHCRKENDRINKDSLK